MENNNFKNNDNIFNSVECSLSKGEQQMKEKIRAENEVCRCLKIGVRFQLLNRGFRQHLAQFF